MEKINILIHRQSLLRNGCWIRLELFIGSMIPREEKIELEI